MSGDSSYVPMNPSESNNFLSKFTLRLSPRIKISTQSIMSKSQSKSYSHTYKYNPDGIPSKEYLPLLSDIAPFLIFLMIILAYGRFSS